MTHCSSAGLENHDPSDGADAVRPILIINDARVGTMGCLNICQQCYSRAAAEYLKQPPIAPRVVTLGVLRGE